MRSGRGGVRPSLEGPCLKGWRQRANLNGRNHDDAVIGRRDAILAMGLGLAAGLAAESAKADAQKTMVLPAGSDTLAELAAKLEKAPRRRDFKSVPMILAHKNYWDHEALDRGSVYRGWPEAGLGQHRSRQPLAQWRAQCAQRPGLQLRAPQLLRRFGDPWCRASRPARSGDVGQISALQADRRQVRQKCVRRRTARRCHRSQGFPEWRRRLLRTQCIDSGADASRRGIPRLPQHDVGSLARS